MAFGVFLHRADSIYDDEPDAKYQFPKQYLGRASQFVNDWIVYYEPVKAGRKGYHAIAKVEQIVPDPTNTDRYLAIIERGSYLPFDRDVPFSDGTGLVERGLLNDAGAISGRAQSAVRPISVEDFNEILERGFVDESLILPREGFDEPVGLTSSLAEERTPFIFDIERQRLDYITSRPKRDRIFRKHVLDAYDRRCAFTGLQIINGGGRAEVQAAHVKAVEYGGPDSVSNGIALSGTAHWMFDRGLLSLSDDLDILVSRHVNDIQSVWNLINDTRKAIAPAHAMHRPHPRFLEWHRNECFKQ